MPEPAVVSLPSIERIRRFQHRAIAFGKFDFARKRCNNTVADLIDELEIVPRLARELLGPENAARRRFDEIDRNQSLSAKRPNRPAGGIIHAELTRDFVGRETLLGERKHRAARDDRQAAQLRQPRDDVVGEPRRIAPDRAGRSGILEGQDRN